VLVAERIGDGPFQGMWEFPGGKIQAGEAVEAALMRELTEEIGIEVNDMTSFMRLEHRYPDRHVEIEFFLVNSWRKDPVGLEGQALKWIPVDQLDHARLLPADEPVVAELRLKLGQMPAPQPD
jgi:8-oxo-dGTP diphosphatase